MWAGSEYSKGVRVRFGFANPVSSKPGEVKISNCSGALRLVLELTAIKLQPSQIQKQSKIQPCPSTASAPT
jgi:hypothetical protein